MYLKTLLMYLHHKKKYIENYFSLNQQNHHTTLKNLMISDIEQFDE